MLYKQDLLCSGNASLELRNNSKSSATSITTSKFKSVSVNELLKLALQVQGLQKIIFLHFKARLPSVLGNLMFNLQFLNRHS